jgi:hypothetical protein
MRTSLTFAAVLTATAVWAFPMTQMTKRLPGLACGSSSDDQNNCTEVLGICNGTAAKYVPQSGESVINSSPNSFFISNQFDKDDASGNDIENMCNIMAGKCCSGGTTQTGTISWNLGPGQLQIINARLKNF